MNEKLKPLTEDSGFTLLEMMVVTVLLAIGAAVTAWSLNLILPDLRLKAAARDLKSDMQMMRLRAIRDNATVTMVFDVAGNNYTIFFDDGSGTAGTGADNWIADGTEEVIKQVAMPLNVTLHTDTSFPTGTNAPRVRFTGLGMPSNSGEAHLTNTLGKIRRVSCSGVAQLQIDESTDGGTSWTNLAAP